MYFVLYTTVLLNLYLQIKIKCVYALAAKNKNDYFHIKNIFKYNLLINIDLRRWIKLISL